MYYGTSKEGSGVYAHMIEPHDSIEQLIIFKLFVDMRLRKKNIALSNLFQYKIFSRHFKVHISLVA